ncbi:MAG: tRNA (adenosine(37)-N6)-threonylcarbamoyltransferase complex ATPase subunit type 1 TsaE [Clostridia bacterium]|jgi:tRNA threonylcarbamoyladenosine biosynthesis protein TsaE|uniref:tRNA (adenosine(37)-N6)-threonylcarbamoyltransferase complex ATPase subunit type 1 TsaE n=1 Tax=Pumilibacter muris TaxID=2941510 RepID=UPI00203BE48F|nr:tRNA (adenosine(37)-N6)-threonylcarbamoyltransferase complex ATPase subunit type 1 TsaE [Pumilibacter muris]MCI8595616.1 tRNA (adenosine(37)-N6)-threonylcarbamoyltransferase complex ATPase subunit type 1 TsaE [Clostridia bacterium]
MKYVSESESQTLEIGRALGKKMRGGEIITLSGDLGAGKTVFTKGIALGLGITDTVASPTFTLMNEYEGRITLYHYDAYRLNGWREAEEAGLTEYFGANRGVCVIEWWENIAEALPRVRTVAVSIKYKDENERIIEIVEQ